MFTLLGKPHAVTGSRWQAAQELEGKDWREEPQIVQNEWQELQQKFSQLLPRIARSVGLKANDQILDVGCGPTVPARLLKAGVITGIDPLADVLHITGKTAIPGVNIINGQAEHMPFSDQTFDFVLCRNTIDHTQNPEAVIKDIHRVLKDNQYLLLISYTYAPFITLVKNLSEQLGLFRNIRHPHSYTPPMLDQLATGRFSIVERFTTHTGQHSTDYGKVGNIQPDASSINWLLTKLNAYLFGSSWFLKEYGYLARKISS